MFFWVIDKKDTIGNFNVLVDSAGKIMDSKLDMDFSSSALPVLLVGYKKILLSEFRINLKKTYLLGNRKGFKLTPIFNVYINPGYMLVNGKVLVKAKYIWLFSEVDEKGGYNKLYLNAETGKIEKEEYITPMP